MIGFLKGTLVSKHPPELTVDVGGVGYELEAPMSTFYRLPESGKPLTLLTHLLVREDAHVLYGFSTEAERALFRNLLKVSGVGARIALGILSGISAEGFRRCVLERDLATLTRIPGIGRKTAERLLVFIEPAHDVPDDACRSRDLPSDRHVGHDPSSWIGRAHHCTTRSRPGRCVQGGSAVPAAPPLVAGAARGEALVRVLAGQPLHVAREAFVPEQRLDAGVAPLELLVGEHLVHGVVAVGADAHGFAVGSAARDRPQVVGREPRDRAAAQRKSRSGLSTSAPCAAGARQSIPSAAMAISAVPRFGLRPSRTP